MQLQTKIPLSQQAHNQIDYNSELLLIGSCFAESIGEKLEYFKFRNLINPFGILFHPLAIENLILRAINEENYLEENVFELNDQWQSFEAHSRLNGQSKETLLDTLNNALMATAKQIESATHVIITLGTSWVYRHISSDRIVANCHKVPQKEFLKELLSIEQITESLQAVITLIKSVNPKVNFVLTVSPVRHLKDGFVENTQSKSHLIAAIHQVVEPRQGIHYFPSYEIVMDELRDYRFYAEDMVHPNPTAIDYIWDLFSDIWINKNAVSTMHLVDEIQRGNRHKPFNENSQQHQQFLEQLSQKKDRLSSEFPHIVF